MQSKTEVFVHLVWATWNRQPLSTRDIEAVFRAIDAKCVDLRCAVRCVPSAEWRTTFMSSVA